MADGKWLKILLLVAIFLFGFLSARMLDFVDVGEDFFSYNILGRAVDVNKENFPSDFLDNDDILVYSDKVILKINNAQISNYQSESMFPFLGKNANGIVIKPKTVDDVHVGDIITFRRGEKLVVHRVVEKGIDEDGVYFVTKGDNSEFIDRKVRFNEIEHKLIGILY